MTRRLFAAGVVRMLEDDPAFAADERRCARAS